MNYFNNINLNQNELQKAVMHPLAQPPATAKEGQMYFNTVDKKLYYYDDTKWVALNDIDLSNYVTTTQLNDGLNKKLDKKTTADSNTQVYAVTGNTQKMIDATSAATKDTVALRDANGKLQVADGAVAADAVNKGQMDTAIATAIEAGISGLERTDNKVTAITGEGSEVQYPSTGAVIEYVKGQVSKVKDVTLDGTSIVNEQGIVALESTYHITLTSTSGNLELEQYNALKADDNSYILYNPGPAFKLTKTYTSSSGEMKYQKVLGNTAYIITIQPSGAYAFSSIVLQDTTQKVTTIDGSSTDTQYPSAKAVYSYVTTELGKIDQFEYKVSTDAASTPEGIVWYSGATESTKITGTLKASATTEYTIYLVPCKHTAAEAQQGYDEYLTIKNSANEYVWEVLGNTRDLDLSDYVSKTKTEPQAIKSSLQLGSDTQNCAFISNTGSYKLLKKGVITEYNADNIVHGSSTLTLPSKAGTIALLSDIPSSPTNMVTTDGNQNITGVKTFDANVILNSTLQAGTSVGTAGQVLTSQGDGKAPIWQTVSDVLPDNVVTTDTPQQITGAKTFSATTEFTNAIKVSGVVGTAGQVMVSQGADKSPVWTTLTIPQGTVKKFVNDFTGNNTDLEFSFEHKLGTDQCTVSLYKLNDSNNYEMVMADIILTTTNVIIKFAQAPATTDSFRVVVTG